MKRVLFSLCIGAAVVACGDGNNAGSEGYVDSSNVTPNSTVNPVDGTGTDTSTMGSGMDTSRMGADTSRTSRTGDTSRSRTGDTSRPQ